MVYYITPLTIDNRWKHEIWIYFEICFEKGTSYLWRVRFLRLKKPLKRQ